MLPNPIFELLGRGVHMYGVFIALGLIACIIVLFIYAKKRNMPPELTDFIFFLAVFAIAIGFLFGMLFQATYNWIESGFKEFDFYSGMTVMGGLIGGAGTFLLGYFLIGKFYFKGKNKNVHIKHFGNLLGFAPCCITIAHAFGRLGCLMAGCCHGEYLGSEKVVGGIYMRGTTNGWGYYVPTQLYEALFLFALFAVLSILYFKRVNIILHIYLIAYAIWRIFIEFFRGDNRGIFLGEGLSPSQWQSIMFIILGAVLFGIYIWKKIPFRLPPFEKQEKAEKTNKKKES